MGSVKFCELVAGVYTPLYIQAGSHKQIPNKHVFYERKTQLDIRAQSTFTIGQEKEEKRKKREEKK